MIAISERENTITHQLSSHDFDLGIVGFRYSDLYDAAKLKAIAEKFYAEVEEQEPVLGEALKKYIAAGGIGYEKRVESKILTDAAPFLSDFIARMFGVKREREDLQRKINEQDPIWNYKFFVQRRAIKKFTAENLVDFNETELTTALREFRNTAFDETLIYDEELAVAFMTQKLTEAEELLTKNLELPVSAQEILNKIGAAYDKLKDKTFGKVFSRFVLEADASGELLQVGAVVKLLEAWSAIQFFKREKKWYAFKTPHGLDYQNLVHLIHPSGKLPNLLRGAETEMRRRVGFKLTDERGTMRDSLYEVDYCLICHEREKDSCSTGLHEKDGSVKRNSLGIKLEGCPLDEKISEMHLLKRQGDSIASLALVTIDNPMCAGTGHRICNDCMKGCIFQKQDPVNIPLAETATLTDVLDLPYGFEIYNLLTRWNPLNAKRPFALPYNGKNILVIGLGPAGYTLAHYLLNEGFGVIGMDGLKIEPLPDEWTG
ncbi:MAG: pyridine nucleotide-disulfide oxidoreductase, partial [Acidobacteriota bacterium]|nr:pyridine nucleotide-disulfide oxidoreductase [Acidobacteriota bacterium]